MECQDGTDGPDCGECVEGYYGDPRNGLACRECPCPNTKASGHSFANTCHLDPNLYEPICDCKEGYAGPRCSICDDNFFGNPEVPGGSCSKCDCSGNWIESDVGNCDGTTGVCLKCIYYTEGDNCERCFRGFFGDAKSGACEACHCNFAGSVKDGNGCDETTGECECLPRVEGYYCDFCRKGYWKLNVRNDDGCEPCGCNPEGSVDISCNQYTGQCLCKEGYGGPKCDKAPLRGTVKK